MVQFRPKKKRKTPASAAPAIRPEAELESRVATALAFAFPNIPRDQLVEQRRFTVRLGHETHVFDSAAQWQKSGRADILIFYKERPLAVLEVKREDLCLTHADYEQAQSYANQLTPRPPLVIVTNGHETRVYDANTGQAWSGENDAAKGVTRLLANAATMAASDMRWAMEALMGRETGVWTRIVRASTAALIAEMTDPPGRAGRPFARDLLFPRLTTLKATKALQSGPLFTVIEGAPVTGKTSLLRELALRTAGSDELAVLMLRGAGPGLSNDARQWLRRMSGGAAGPAMVVAIDGVDPGTAMAMDLEELASLRPGAKLKVILTTDQPEGLVKAPNGRTETALGAQATRIELGPLGLHEFKAAKEALKRAKIVFLDGAEYAEDYRAPWVLRTLYDHFARDPRFADPTHAVLLPASLGLQFVDAARETYAGQTELLRGYRLLARDALSDSQTYSAELALAASNGFIIRRDALSAEAQDSLAGLKAANWVRTYRHAGREDVVVPTVPAAYLTELADAAGDELGRRAEADPRGAGVWLGRRLDASYLGDLIGAQAIRSLADKTGGFSSGIVGGLLLIEPQEKLVERALISLATPDGQLVHIKIENGKAWLSNHQGEVHGEEIDLGAERSRMYANTTAWMILGQLARLPTAAVGDDHRRMDAWILLKIGQCPFPLLRANEEGLGHLEHDLNNLGRVLCQKRAPVEAATQAMAELLSRHWADADAWVDAVLESGSLPLVHRVMIALRTVQARNIPGLSAWAHGLLEDRVLPAITAAIATAERAPGIDVDQ
jgi:Type I restriction enzyme R protein N terminus (HSDR_N)